jgi:cytochrome c-type biogenesis protein CcmH/NrfG
MTKKRNILRNEQMKNANEKRRMKKEKSEEGNVGDRLSFHCSFVLIAVAMKCCIISYFML